MRTDSVLYKFFDYYPEALLLLINEKKDRNVRYKFESVDVKETQLHIDGVISPNTRHNKIYFVEFHFRRENIYSKLFAEIFMFLHKEQPQNDWQAVVIFPNKKADLGVGIHYRDFLITERLKIIYLDDLPSEIFNKLPLKLLKIIIEKDEKIQDLINNLSFEIKSLKSGKEKLKELTISLVMSKLSKLELEEIHKMLKPFLDDIKKAGLHRN
jgi:predicted transposase YdaD